MNQAETLYERAIIHTMDPERPRAEALLVRDGRIAAVGSEAEVRAAAPAGTRRVDLEGQTVIPGFNDCHSHILGLGMMLAQVDCSVDVVESIDEIVAALQRRAAETPAGTWIVGRGYDQNMLAEGRHPTRADLDVIAEHLVVIRHTSGHVLTANSAALALAGMSANTPNPSGGEIERDEHGEPTGVLKEAAMGLIDEQVPPATTAEGTAAIKRALAMMASFGITSATDANTDPTELAMYRQAGDDHTVRVGLLIGIRHVAPPGSDEVRMPEEFEAGEDEDWLAIFGTKIFSDGAMSTRTAALREPYADDPENRGIVLWPLEVLARMMTRAHVAGWHIATHALGDRAVAGVLECYRQAIAASPRSGHRHRIEHAMVVDDDLAAGMRDLGIVGVLQPDIFRLGDGYIPALGLERAAEVIPMKVFARQGVRLAFSSDAPVIPCDPLQVIRSAAERRTPSGAVLGPQHSVAPLTSIELYTAGSAFATRREDVLGRLRPGCLADFAVLSGDPGTTPIDEFERLRVTMTVAGGRVTYGAD